MAIDINRPITYSDLIEYFLNKIQTICVNVTTDPQDTMNLPITVKTGGSTTIFGNSTNGSTDMNFTAYTNGPSDILPSAENSRIVSPDMVKFQLQTFLKSRGVWSTPNVTISSKGIINLFNHFSVFASAHIVSIHNTNATDGNPQTYIFYNSNTDDNPLSTGEHNVKYDTLAQSEWYRTDDILNKKENKNKKVDSETAKQNFMKDTLKSFITEINRVENIANISMSYGMACSSSSSSSSCSCSSSCCSSSSSSFIVYMLI